MRIGISTWAYQDLSLKEALEKISQLSSRAEVLCEARHSLFDPRNLEAMECFNLDYTVHGLVTDVNIASIYPGLRSASMELHRKAAEASATAGAELYVVHPGFASWSFYREKAMRALDESISELARMEEELGIRIAIENMPKSDWLFFEQPGLDLKGMGMVLDVGHADTCSCLGEFLKRSDILHIHLHDNSGSSDDHLALGKGNIDFRPVLEMIESRGSSAVLENKSEGTVMESLGVLKNIQA